MVSLGKVVHIKIPPQGFNQTTEFQEAPISLAGAIIRTFETQNQPFAQSLGSDIFTSREETT